MDMNVFDRTCVMALVLGSVLLLTPAGPAAADEAVTGSVAGWVLSSSGEVVDGLELVLQPAVTEVVAGEDGSFRISGLEAGVYVLTAVAEGYSSRSLVLTVEAGAALDVDLRLTPAFRSLGEITVSSSFSLNRSDPSPGVVLDRRQLLELPHLGDDVIRALPLLPGVAAGDTSAQFNVRGGLTREVLFQLDGLEIYEPYHLQDFGAVFSIIDPRLLDEVQLLPGGFPVEYGDRSGAVLDLTTVSPDGPPRYEVGVSLLTMWGNGQGGFADDRGTWFASLRRGYLDLILDLVGPEDEETEKREGSGPAYWDFNAKVGYRFDAGHELTSRILWSDDRNDQEEWEIEDGEPEYEFWDTSYGNASLWLHYGLVLGRRAYVSTVASYNRVDRDRSLVGEDSMSTQTIRDKRDLDVLGLRQDWSLEASTTHSLKWGFDLRRFDASFDYFSEFSNFLVDEGSTVFLGDFDSTSAALYAADRMRLGDRLTAEIGARWDRHELTDEDHVSPRLNLALALSPATVVRAGWGHFHQSQRPHELQVEDGEIEHLGAERAEHRTLGLETWWQRGGGAWSLRAEVYQRLVDDVRPRYENLFDPFPQFPETSYDRYRIAPESSEAVGAELFVARRGSGRLDWWANYTWSETTDLIDGRDVPRQFDQTHAFTLSATWRPSPVWTFSGAWIYHTGWPTTAVSGQLVDGEVVPVLGPVNAENLPDYHRLDLRFSRRVQLKRRGTLELFLDVQNAYNRLNVSGYEVDDRAFSVGDGGEVVYTPRPEEWLGIVPSFGVSWIF